MTSRSVESGEILLRALLGRIPDQDLAPHFTSSYEAFVLRPRRNVDRLEAALKASTVPAEKKEAAEAYVDGLKRVFVVVDNVFDTAHFAACSLLGQLRMSQPGLLVPRPNNFGKGFAMIVLPLIELLPSLNPDRHAALAQTAFDFFGTEYPAAYIPMLNIAQASEKYSIFFLSLQDRQNEYYKRVWGTVPETVKEGNWEELKISVNDEVATEDMKEAVGRLFTCTDTELSGLLDDVRRRITARVEEADKAHWVLTLIARKAEEVHGRLFGPVADLL